MNRIKELRLHEGLKQKELAEELGVKQNTLSTWETGRYEPDGAMLKALAVRLHTTTDYILGGSDKKEPALVPNSKPDILEKLEALSPAAQQEVYAFIEFKKAQSNRNTEPKGAPAHE